MLNELQRKMVSLLHALLKQLQPQNQNYRANRVLKYNCTNRVLKYNCINRVPKHITIHRVPKVICVSTGFTNIFMLAGFPIFVCKQCSLNIYLSAWLLEYISVNRNYNYNCIDKVSKNNCVHRALKYNCIHRVS